MGSAANTTTKLLQIYILKRCVLAELLVNFDLSFGTITTTSHQE